MMGVNSWCTGGVAYTAKRAWNWGEALCWTVVTHRARAISGEVGSGLWYGTHGPTLAKITLQTRP